MEELLPTEINVVTLNCWGLKYLSQLRSERLAEIGRRLATSEPTPHIVALQECRCQDDYKTVRRETRFVLPYGKFYHAGVFGAGLVILSRWPIEESSMFQYPLNGRPTAFFRGDWFVGKGVACAKIRYGPGLKHVIEVFNTHTHSPYEEPPKTDSYRVHRTAQAWEFAKLLRGAADRGHLVLGLGDLNAVPSSLFYRLVVAGAPVRDAWRSLHPDAALGPADDPAERARRRPIPTARFSLAENGATSGCVLNTWRWPAHEQRLLPARRVPLDAIDARGKRLDYIFVSAGGGGGGGGWVVKSARVGMVDGHPELGCSLSDHFSVEATLVFHSGRTGRGGGLGNHNHHGTSDEDAAQVTNGTYLLSPASSFVRGSRGYDAQLAAFAANAPDLFVSAATYDEVLADIHAYTARERRQRRWRARHFCAWLAVAAACHVAVWFSPRPWVAFLLMLLASVGLAAGTVDGLIALLFMGSELRALKELQWEIMNARAVASGGPPLVGDDDERGKAW